MSLISPQPKLQFFDNNGAPLVGGKLYTYAAGSTTPLSTYTNESGATANPNPVILNSRGEASVWLGVSSYKFKLATSTDVELWTVDNISGGVSSVDPTFSGTTTFTGNMTVEGNTVLGNSSGDTVTINALNVVIPNSLNFDSNTLYIDSGNNRVGIGTNTPAQALDVQAGTVQAGGLLRSVSGALTISASNAAGTIDLQTAGVSRATITAAGVFNYGGVEVGYRSIPRTAPSGALTATTAIRGGCYSSSYTVDVPANVFAPGDAFSVYNDSASSISITQGAGLTLRQGGTTNTGNRTLSAKGIATIWFNSTTEAVITGAGLS